MKWKWFPVIAGCLLVALGALAQVTTGSLTGTVTTGGNSVPGATVTVTSPSLFGARTNVTDANGNYNFAGLPPGEYTVKIELAGLQSVTQHVRVPVSQVARADAQMVMGNMNEAITVTASAPAVLETTEVQTNVPAKLVEKLPLGRTLLAAVNLAPGVTSNGPAGATMISGGQSFDSTFYVDGAIVNEVLRGQPQDLFIEDALQETTVQTGAINAEFGHFTGGVVTAISKSGGNDFGGSFRDTLTNPKWTTKGEKQTAEPTDSIFNTYEATLGGRVIRDRLWFFTAGRYRDLNYQRRFFRAPGDKVDYTFPYNNKERRVELKMTGQLTAAHSLTGSYFDISNKEKNYPFVNPLEFSTLDAERSLPNRFYTIDYNGILTNSFLIEALYAKQTFKFVDAGADASASPERGTNIYYPLLGAGGSFAGYPAFCGGCSAFPESRNNESIKLKGNYFLSSKGLGTHNLSAGYENFKDMLKNDNYQSASNFVIYTYDSPSRTADGTLLNSISPGGGFIVWWPILNSSQGNAFTSRAFFFNDKWDLSQRLNFNLGVRYDDNQGENQAHAKVASDSKISPRLGVTYDVFGTGRLRLNGSYSQYVSKIANGNVGDISSNAGSPALLYWLYYGPEVANVPTNSFLDQVFAWFDSIGGTKNQTFVLGGGTPGISPQIQGKLTSPGVTEFTVGAGMQIGRNSFLRLDYQDRKWDNFYGQFANTSTGQVFDPLAGGIGADTDLILIHNSDSFTRKYKAVIVQGGARLFSHVDLGGNYTYSKLRGNIIGETSGSGPIVTATPEYFPEFRGYPNANPIGYLTQDQRHKARVWASVDIPTFIGNFNVSALQRYDSGTPYGAQANVWLVSNHGDYPGYPNTCPTCPTNDPEQGGPGYTAFNISPFSNAPYWFTPRDAYRTDNISATDFALSYFLPIRQAQLFVEAKLFNAFNGQGVVNVNQTVRTAVNSSCVQTIGANAGKHCAAFNPFTEAPIEGINWVKGASFGKPITPSSGEPFGGVGDFQQPRTYRLSVGARF